MLAETDYTSNRFNSSNFSHSSISNDSSGPGRGQAWLLWERKNPEVPHFNGFLIQLSAPSFLRPVGFSAAAAYPVGTANAAIRRTMLPNSRRHRFPRW
jgi:hypothetical protein